MLTLFGEPPRDASSLARYIAQLERNLDRIEADASVVRALRLQRADVLIRTVFDKTFDAILILREDNRIDMANDAAVRLFGHSHAALAGRKVAELLPEIGALLDDAGDRPVETSGYFEIHGRRQDGSTFAAEVAMSDGRIGESCVGIAVVRDVTERKAQQQALEHQALHDALTGLPNRLLMMDRLEHALNIAKRDGKPMALLVLDLDRFKEINDTLGHQAGDMVLRDVGQRLVACIRSSDTIARIGGDEFAVLLPAVSDLERARRVSLRLADALATPISFRGLTLHIGVSIGIAMYPEHADERDRLLQCADIAMYAAKKEQVPVSVYDDDKNRHSVRHLTLTGELRQAIERRQITLCYQPKLSLTSGLIEGVEALARWQHPVYGPISPSEFILQAERTGLIQSLTWATLDMALGQLAQWRRLGLDTDVAINLSARALHDGDLPQMLRELLLARDVPATRVTLEITETAIMIDPEKAMAVVAELHESGHRISIDDFGTGYSSLSYLSRLPVDELKIDRGFVNQMIEKRRDAKIVQSTIDLAHNMGLKVIAEGIETQDVIDELTRLGCDLGQGYFIGKPMSAEAVTAWLEGAPFEVRRIA